MRAHRDYGGKHRALRGLHSIHILYVHIMASKLSVFMKLLSVQTHGSLILLSSFFSCWLFLSSNFYLIVFYLSIMFYYYLLEACSLLIIDRKEVNLDGKGGMNDLGRVNLGKTIIRMYYVPKESIFNNS